MVKTDELPPVGGGARLLASPLGPGRPVQLTVRLVAIDEAQRLLVAAPGSDVVLPQGCPVTLVFFRRGVLFHWESTVEAADEINIRLAPPAQATALRQRRAPRLTVFERARFARLAPGSFSSFFGAASLDERVQLWGTVKQLGPNGLGMLVSADLRQRDQIALGFAPDGEELRVVGRVAWVADPSAYGGDTHQRAVGIEFGEIDEAVREKLKAYLAAESDRRRTQHEAPPP